MNSEDLIEPGPDERSGLDAAAPGESTAVIVIDHPMRIAPPRPAAVTGRPRSMPGEEAYLRSELERAAIDIAAGW
jgi:hypothetical protein